MRWMVPAAVLVLAASCWAQSLGDVVRADRERAKPHAKRVVTNENLDEPATEEKNEPLDPLQRELERVRAILRGICADPRTENGRSLSESDKQALNEGVKPLRVRVENFQRLGKKYRDELAALDQEFEAKTVKAVYTGKPLSDEDIERVRTLRQEHDARRAAILQQSARESDEYKAFQQEIEAAGTECPAAAASVPD